MERTLYEEQHELFREGFHAFVRREIVPHIAKWEADGIVDKHFYRTAGAAGFLGLAVPVQYGGGGTDDFRFNAVMHEEFARVNAGASSAGMALFNDIIVPYLVQETNDEQKARLLPPACSGEIVMAIAMSEPGAGSDLAAITTTARRDGDEYVINGAKTFISNGINADVVIVAAKTDLEARHHGITLVLVEADRDGFERGRNLDKIGLHAQDTAELFFTDVRVPVSNRLGAEGAGFAQLMTKLSQERLAMAVVAVSQAEAAFDYTLRYAKDRHAFGQSIGSFQYNRFTLAEIRTELDIARVFVDRQIEEHHVGRLRAEDAAKAKWWTTELQWRVLNRCLQLHGGYGYMEEYPIARAWRDARVQTIYGGTTEIMKEIIGRSLGL